MSENVCDGTGSDCCGTASVGIGASVVGGAGAGDGAGKYSFGGTGTGRTTTSSDDESILFTKRNVISCTALFSI